MDLALLGYKVDTAEVSAAEKKLDGFGRANQQTARQVQQTSRAMETGFRRTSIAAGGLANALRGPGIRNASLQLSQVAQQTAATGNFVQALAIQLPDLTLGFGTVGIAAGVAAGALLPLAANLLDTTEEAGRLGDAMDDVAARILGAQEALRAFNLGLGSTEELVLFDQIRSLSEEINEIEGNITQLENERSSGYARQLRNLRSVLASLSDERAELVEQLDLLQAAEAERDRIIDSAKETADAERLLGEQMQQTARAAAMVAVEMERSRDAAMAAAREFMTMQDIRSRFAGEEAVMGQDVLQVGRGDPAPQRPRQGRARGSEVNARALDAQRIFDQTRSAAERYAIELADLNELQRMGYFNADTFARAVQNLDREFAEAQLEPFVGSIDSLTDSIADAIFESESLGDAFSATLKRMASELVSSGIRELILGTFNFGGGGGGGGGFLSSLFGGFREAGGPVQPGKAYVVGEKRPELFVPQTAGTILPSVPQSESRLHITLGVPQGVTVDQVVQISGDVSVQVVAENNRTQDERQRRSNTK